MSELQYDPKHARRVVITAVAMAVIAAVAGTAGWWLALWNETTVYTEARNNAKQQCQVAIEESLRQAMGSFMVTHLDFNPFVGTDPHGTFIGSVPGSVSAVAPGEKTLLFRCTLHDYDRSASRWGRVSIGWDDIP